MPRTSSSAWVILALAACSSGVASVPDASNGLDAVGPRDAEILTADSGHDVGDASTPADGGPLGPDDDATAAPADAATADAATADAAVPDAAILADAGTSTTTDLDHDGLDDADEARWAAEYLPFLAVAPDDRCPRVAILYRLRPHPMQADRLLLVVLNLFENDCGAGGHVGDDEVFGLTIDPARRGPAGILALRAIAHQSTACEEVSDCGACAGLTACPTNARRGQMYPTVFFSSGKHGAYVSEAACDRSCFFTNFCTAPTAGVEPPMLNAGEPDHPLTRDLTASGLITAAAGWTAPELMGFDPWGSHDFGGAGDTTSDLTDAAFVTPACP